MPSGPLTTSRRTIAWSLLLSGPFCAYLMDIPTLIANFPSPSATGYIEWAEGKVAILDRFHWLAFLDEVFRDVTVGFAPSAMGYDDVSRWMMGPFMGDVGVWFGVWLCEGGRERGAGFSPVVFALFAQLVGGGVMLPIYYGLFLLFTPAIGRKDGTQRRIDLGKAWIYLPLLFIFHYAPVAGMMYHPSFQSRHYWTWAWQLYSVRIWLAYEAIRFVIRYLPFRMPNIGKKLSYRASISLLLAPLIAISVGMWTYTLFYCPYPLRDVYFPHPLVEDTWEGRLRRILQFDYLFVNGSGLAWVLMLLREVRPGGTIKRAVAAVVATVLVGPAAALGVLWVWKESLVGGGEEEGNVVAEKRKVG
ncbi:hypothetical protein K458DRAFT_422460 [Lentithecium fluviatile CBS 122367]|uniref:Uncharacterized protein n=1 Tax=Lentithecium fluviatile CBS 122367 TaxID=1168545 RepID=A0A6G1IMM1_9PLEO|nr:hypothetical protein K458DRAFT_422460 [Lentithecium fluviatile CBS 122367]